MKNQCRNKCEIKRGSARERKRYAKYSICTIMMYESHPRTGCMWCRTTTTTIKEIHFRQFSLTQKLCVKDNDTFIFINKLEMFQTRHFVLFLAIEISHTLCFLYYQLSSNCCTHLNISRFSFIYFCIMRRLWFRFALLLLADCSAAGPPSWAFLHLLYHSATSWWCQRRCCFCCINYANKCCLQQLIITVQKLFINFYANVERCVRCKLEF